MINRQAEWTGGGFLSNSIDLARWAKLLYEGQAFDKSMLPVMEAGVPARTGKGDEYGLGVQIRHTPYGITYGHGGWFPVTFLRWNISRKSALRWPCSQY